ncbi:MAG: two-component system CheB/CheR fusion protein [Paracoccaceae bacterium]|jgi:two-component system CheB/CheR fusion protein
MTETQDEPLTIIGIGSSAGGLEAIRQLVETLPTESPVSYVVVQHMSPHHKSLMTLLVARDTKLVVKDVEDGTIPERNIIYITPPKTDIIFMDGKLRLVAPSPEAASPKPSVDRFLTSLAQEHGAKSMAIILSGTGRDGAYGVQAIREAGGITIAQDNETAKYDGMPQSAVQTGCVDLILSPPDIGNHLQKILSSRRDFTTFKSGTLQDTPKSDLLQILLARTRVDFREYKQTTIGRRIERRMVALNIQSEEEYTQFCRANPSAVDALFKDLLISVTRFFRDKEAFRDLEALLPELIAKSSDGQLRIWIAGCATGEEAYSVAMLLSEALGGVALDFQSRVQIFATDIDRDALQVARKGIYGLSALDSIPPALAEKYLIRQNDGVRVVENLRRAILFSDHNVCQDPPFQKVDLVCCRNLLIYLGNNLQKKVMGRFHYAMKPDALLFLGTAESVAGSDELFAVDRSASHVFRKRMLRKEVLQAYTMPNPSHAPRQERKTIEAPHGPSTDRQLLEALARSLGENSILVTDEYFIAQIFGDISPYIALTQTSNLRMHIDLLRSPLREEARSLITIALKNKKQRSGVRHLMAENDEQRIRLDVYPIIAKDINERAALIVFTPVEPDKVLPAVVGATPQDGAEVRQRMLSLENEVATTREALQQTIEELETSNEELQSLNEELQSTNEELQATNEELETSNEELQSTNEELITVNEELQITASELTGRTGELSSVLESTPVAIIVTDTALQATQATGVAMALFGLQRPFSNPHVSQFNMPDGFPTLAPICSEAMKLGEAVHQEFSSNGAQVVLGCSPYFDNYGKILGVTIIATTFPGLAREMETILASDNVFVMQRKRDGEIIQASNAYAKMLGVSPEDTKGKNFTELLDESSARIILEQDAHLIDNETRSTDTIIKIFSQHTNELKWLNVHKYPYFDHTSSENTIFSVGSDVTDTILTKNKAQALAKQVEHLQELAGLGSWTVDILQQKLHWSDEVYRIHRTTPQRYTPTLATALQFYHPDDIENVTQVVENALQTGNEFKFIKRIVAADKSVILVESIGLPILDAYGETTSIVGFFREVQSEEFII